LLFKLFGEHLKKKRSDDILPVIDEAFRESCEYEHLEISKWLYNLGVVSIWGLCNSFNDSCYHEHFEVTKWLLSLKEIGQFLFNLNRGVMANDNQNCLASCAVHKRYDVLDLWFNIESDKKQEFMDHECMMAARLCRFDLVFYLLDKGADIHYNDDLVFHFTCMAGYLEGAKKLYELGKLDIHVQNDRAFQLSCEHGHIEVAEWLYSFGGIEMSDKIIQLYFDTKKYDKLIKLFKSHEPVIGKCGICRDNKNLVLPPCEKHGTCIECFCAWFRNHDKKCLICQCPFKIEECYYGEKIEK